MSFLRLLLEKLLSLFRSSALPGSSLRQFGPPEKSSVTTTAEPSICSSSTSTEPEVPRAARESDRLFCAVCCYEWEGIVENRLLPVPDPCPDCGSQSALVVD